jgi:protein TonB
VGTVLVCWQGGSSAQPAIDFELTYVHEADAAVHPKRDEEPPREDVAAAKEVPLEEPDVPDKLEEPQEPPVRRHEFLPLEPAPPIRPEVWFQVVCVRKEQKPEPLEKKKELAEAKPAPSPPAAKPTPIIGENPPPEYPRRAIRLSIEGRVLIEVTVDAQGSVTACKVLKSSGHDVLDRAALKAVRTWRFSNGPGVVCVPVDFILRRR